MTFLTLQNMDPNRLGYYDWQQARKGQDIYTAGKTALIEFTGETAKVHVLENLSTFTVSLQAETKTTATYTCNCPLAAKQNICRHIVAAIFETREYIRENAENQWRYRLGMALENTPKKKKAITSGERYIFFFGVTREKQSDNTFRLRLVPYKLQVKALGDFDHSLLADGDALADYLQNTAGWHKQVELVGQKLRIYDCANMAPETVQFYNLMMGKDVNVLYYRQAGFLDFAEYLPFIGERKIPLFWVSARGELRGRIQILDKPVVVEAAMTRSGDQIHIEAGVTLEERLYSTSKNNLSVIARNPDWIMAGDFLAPVENSESLDLMHFFPLSVPKEEEEAFRQDFFLPLAERLPISGDVVAWRDVDVQPSACLYLDEVNGQLMAELAFMYVDTEGEKFLVDVDPKAPPLAVVDNPGSWTMVRIHRNLKQEAYFEQLLTDARYGLKRAGKDFGPGIYELRTRTHPLDFLMHAIPELTRAGFEIYGEENVKTARINRSTPQIKLNLTSGIDWFEVEATLMYGDQSIGMNAVRKAVRRGDHYVKLADGSIGQIPEDLLKRYKVLFDLSNETENGVRVADFHLPLVDELLKDAAVEAIPQDFLDRRNRLKGFDEIKDQPLPSGFNGELRPYQKAGLDWLHFLHDYRFGGCLADDMGLGKTIQVLAFLQSLKEQGKISTATLLVVPKSLISNWQREANKFTPGLKIMVFMGNTRKKDYEQFSGFDLILTTYGTMLRDVEFLRGYTFAYIILDESQAIKNPLAQSTKAARLLKSNFRLVMTGTPVENNSFELWSQFAFLNPGLLGSVEYFKHEFAQPIEVEHDQTTADMLKKLIFPFILRRTKEQVAPELPPRTERVIYTDLGPAQRKLYTQTRDRYRQELLGMIETQGMNDSRMKILEGLLRLRQTCIHPLLVDKTYHGDSAKFELLFETIETLKAEQHKALIFSQFVETLSLVRRELDRLHISYAYLDGQTKDRQGQVDLFQTDPAIAFFLISLKAGGVGLNLTAADYVIHLDPWWNPAVEMQAADRAHRIGQDKPVFVYKFIARDTVEEKILMLQERKRELVDQLVSAEGSFFKSITANDVKDLFS